MQFFEMGDKAMNDNGKFIYSEKATKFCEISLDVVPVKSIAEISQNFGAFSECINFTEQNWIDVLAADWRRYKIVQS